MTIVTSAAADLPHPDDKLTIIPRLFSIMGGRKWRNTFAIPFMLVSMMVLNSSAGTSHILLFLLIAPALFTWGNFKISIALQAWQDNFDGNTINYSYLVQSSTNMHSSSHFVIQDEA